MLLHENRKPTKLQPPFLVSRTYFLSIQEVAVSFLLYFTPFEQWLQSTWILARYTCKTSGRCTCTCKEIVCSQWFSKQDFFTAHIVGTAQVLLIRLTMTSLYSNVPLSQDSVKVTQLVNGIQPSLILSLTPVLLLLWRVLCGKRSVIKEEDLKYSFTPQACILHTVCAGIILSSQICARKHSWFYTHISQWRECKRHVQKCFLST